ncbi:MAG: AbrB/MazE/SpoVT family DNA-binding domain-containing protein [Acidithiobacillus sp.]
MLAKMTSKNQITLPKAAIQQVASAQYFEVEAKDGRIILTPVRLQKADAVREKLASMGIGEEDVADAVRWARQRG